MPAENVPLHRRIDAQQVYWPKDRHKEQLKQRRRQAEESRTSVVRRPSLQPERSFRSNDARQACSSPRNRPSRGGSSYAPPES